MDEMPVLTDTEVETSMEQDGEEKLFTKISNNATVNSRRSLYDISFDNSNIEKHESVEFKDYESRLHKEMKYWKSVLHNAYKDFKQSKQKHPVVDKTILPPEKLEYLKKAECLQKFIRESIEFRQQAVLFLHYDYAELMEMIENFEDLSEHKLNLIKSCTIAENLANADKTIN